MSEHSSGRTPQPPAIVQRSGGVIGASSPYSWVSRWPWVSSPKPHERPLGG